jgi:hypothetical protein
LIEASAAFVAHLNEGNGHAFADFDIFDDRSGTHFPARHIKYDFDHAADGRRVRGGNEQAAEAQGGNARYGTAAAMLPRDEHAFGQRHASESPFHGMRFLGHTSQPYRQNDGSLILMACASDNNMPCDAVREIGNASRRFMVLQTNELI